MNGSISFEPGGSSPLDLDVLWSDGTDPAEAPAQIHHLDQHTVVIRQSLRVSSEAPFVALLFGNERAFLLDTGDDRDREAWPLRQTVDELMDLWLSSHPRDDYTLIVAHTHAHGDHIAGDPQLADRPLTTVVGSQLDDVREFFGFDDWPDGSSTVDLGGRILTVIPSPGHHETAISVLDSYTRLLFSGDTVYPGRLYVPDMEAFLTTMDRLAELAESGEVSHVLGCHVELDRCNDEFPLGVSRHPDEAAPFMAPDRLVSVRDAARTVADVPGVHPFDGFVIYNGNRLRDQLGLLFRSWRSRLRS